MSMEPSDPKPAVLPKALVIVEGEDAEPRLLRQLASACKLNLEMEIVPVRFNIHQLYQLLAAADFQADIRKILAGLPTIPDDQKALLSSTRFAYTYLMYDADLQHRYPGEEALPIEDVVRSNLGKLEKMTAYFTDETDPSVGRLYANWPMVESYRDCDDFFDPTFRDNFVAIADLNSYKAIVGRRKHASLNLSKYDESAFKSLMRMNIHKIASFTTSNWTQPPYSTYLTLSTAASIFRAQQTHITATSTLGVLNTTLLLPLDYYGELYYEAIRTSFLPTKRTIHHLY